ncbi:MAG: metallophosphoesterase [Clostridiales bacterium]|nr:metallophosphoesterase [Clostridiales bacterium]
MWLNFVRKFYTVLFAVIMAFTTVEVAVPFLMQTADVSYSFSDDLPGDAGGTVSVTANIPGKYKLYWGDSDGKRLTMDDVPFSQFAEVTVSGGEGSADIYEFTAIPEGAEKVLVFRGAVKLGETDVPEGKKPEDEEPSYTFGALSDVHFNRYNMSLTGDDALITFRNALDFLKERGVDTVGISGDISNRSELDSFEKYNKVVSEYDFPIYTCTGNHDAQNNFKERWTPLVNTDVFVDQPRSGICETSDNGLDFVYAPSKFGGDAFVFFSQTAWDYNRENSRIVDDSQLDWLEDVLEKYRSYRVWLFFHTFLADDKNDPTCGEGNLINNKGEYYDLVYTVGTADEVRFRSILKKYKNVVFFNGHSHWEFEGISMNPILNITNYGGTYATFVHVPSVSSPRRIQPNGKNTEELFMRSSEGYYIEVYDDRTVLYGVQFWGKEYQAYATYTIWK